MKRKALALTVGFTLVELLVVIAIIALLLAIISPSFSSAIAMGRATTCKNNLQKLAQAFALSNASRAQKGSGQTVVADVADVYPDAELWPSIPMDAVPSEGIYACPEDDVVETLAGSLADLEYENKWGKFSLDAPGTYENMYKSRRGADSKGGYTEYLFQDDQSNQYYDMNFNGWIDTDGGMRIYDAGEILVFSDLVAETAGSVPDWSGCSGPGYPIGINTCPDQNDMLYKGTGAFNGEPRMNTSSSRGQSFQLPDWGVGTNYGMNSYAYKASFGSTIIVLVDYTDTLVDVDYPEDAEVFLLSSGRHPGEKVNYLRANGSVKTATPMEISPRLQTQKWK